MKKLNQSSKGFTLVEIMIVVVIIGLLAAMAIPAFQKVRAKSIQSTMDNDARQVTAAANQYFLEYAVSSVATTDLVGTNGSNYMKGMSSKNTLGPGTLTMNSTFSISNPIVGTVTYTIQ